MSRVSIHMPKLGLTAEEGQVLEWLKQVGDPVTEGEGLLEFDTEKVTSEIEAPATGVLVEQCAQPGDVVPVGAVVGYISVG